MVSIHKAKYRSSWHSILEKVQSERMDELAQSKWGKKAFMFTHTHTHTGLKAETGKKGINV